MDSFGERDGGRGSRHSSGMVLGMGLLQEVQHAGNVDAGAAADSASKRCMQPEEDLVAALLLTAQQLFGPRPAERAAGDVHRQVGLALAQPQQFTEVPGMAQWMRPRACACTRCRPDPSQSLQA